MYAGAGVSAGSTVEVDLYVFTGLLAKGLQDLNQCFLVVHIVQAQAGDLADKAMAVNDAWNS